ncbi:MAG: hypothetical protein U0234_31105 [Sandaracinus sp.]
MKRQLLPLLLLTAGFLLGRASLETFAFAQPTTAGEGATEETTTVPEGQPRYLAAMRAELAAMGIEDAACEATDAQRAHCRLTQSGGTTDRAYEVHLAYSDVTDTIYAYIDRYLVAPGDGEHTDALMRRLMELNWTMLLGKFEWDPTDGEVRLAMVLNTDSNFDRRAFRSTVRALTALADRHYGELNRLRETGR